MTAARPGPSRRRAGNQRGQPHPRRHRQNAAGLLARPMVRRPRDPRGRRQPGIRGPAGRRRRPERRGPRTGRAAARRAALAESRSRGGRPQRRSASSAAGRSSWTTPSSIAASPATWTSSCWTPWSRWASGTSFPGARSASRSKGCGGRTWWPCRGPTCWNPKGGRNSAGSGPTCPAGGLAGNAARPAGVGLRQRRREPLESLQAGRWPRFAASAIPPAFATPWPVAATRLAGFREFPDHHAYTPRDLADLAAWARPARRRPCSARKRTWSSCPSIELGDLPLRAVAIDLEILAGREVLESRLEILAKEEAVINADERSGWNPLPFGLSAFIRGCCPFL